MAAKIKKVVVVCKGDLKDQAQTRKLLAAEKAKKRTHAHAVAWPLVIAGHGKLPRADEYKWTKGVPKAVRDKLDPKRQAQSKGAEQPPNGGGNTEQGAKLENDG